MISKIRHNGMEKWWCDICDTKWLPRTDEPKYLRCPNLECRAPASRVKPRKDGQCHKLGEWIDNFQPRCLLVSGHDGEHKFSYG